jgi:type IV secretory pathway VirB10-like protein
LKEHGQLKAKWLPVQAVHMLYNSCAFVVLSGSVMHADAWSKWRAAEKPDDWKIMTKVEHTKRTAEYIALLQTRNPQSWRKVKPDYIVLPAIAQPAALAMDAEVIPDYTARAERPKNKRKRNRRKGDKQAHQDGDIETNNSDDAMTQAQADKDGPPSKRRA